MDDEVGITDEELDRLIAEVSGDCDVGEGDDFDIVSELDELNNTSEIGSGKEVAPGSGKDVTASVKTKEDEKKDVKETAAVSAAVTDDRKDGTTAGGKPKRGETAGQKAMEKAAVIAKAADTDSANVGGKELVGEAKVPESEGKIVSSDAKSHKKEAKLKTAAQTGEDSAAVGKVKSKDEIRKVVDDQKSVKDGAEVKLNEGSSKKATRKSPVKQKTDDEPLAKGSEGSRSKGAGASTHPRAKSTTESAVAPPLMVKESDTGGGGGGGRGGSRSKGAGASAHSGKKAEQNSPRVQSTTESTVAPPLLVKESEAGGGRGGDASVAGIDASDAESLAAPLIQGAKVDDGKAEVKRTSSPSVDSSGSSDKLDPSVEKIGEKAAGTTQSTAAEISSDSKSSRNVKKGSWGWNSIGSWGSSVLSQVGGGLYHVLETVESSLVEPVDKDSSTGEVKQPVVVVKADVVTEAPSLSSIDKELEVSGSATKGENRKKEDVADVAASSFGDAKVDETGAEAEEDSDRTKTSRQKRSLSKGESKDRGPHEHSWFSGWGLSAISGAVQQTGKKVVSTGMDVLENIGRKTMSVLSDESEDGVAPLSPSSPSQPAGSKKKKKSESRKNEASNAQMLRKCFDDCQGLAHFDALSDLSQMSQQKLTKQLERISGDWLSAVKADLALIKDASDLGGMDWEESFGNTDHDFHQLIKDFICQLSLSINIQKLFNVQETTSKWLSSCLRDNAQDKKYSAEDIHKMAILMFADFTATGIAQFHKIAQLLLVDYSTPILSYKFRALSLTGLTKVLCTEIWIEARKFTDCLNQSGEMMESPDVIVSLVTNLTLEASNCSSCIQDGFRLLLPIIQLAALKVHPLMSDCSEIANLEVLQLMSGMSRSKVNRILNQLSADSKQSVQIELSAVESAFDLSFLDQENDGNKSDSNFGPTLLDCLRQIGADINTQKLIRAHERTYEWLLSCEADAEKSTPPSPSDINQMALKSFNDLTFCSIELFHQLGQVILMENPQEISAYGKRASAIQELAKVLCLEVGHQSTKFTNCILRLSKTEDESSCEKNLEIQSKSFAESLSPLVTNIYLEASNSTTYIQDGFQLLLPIVQLALFKAHPACSVVLDS